MIVGRPRKTISKPQTGVGPAAFLRSSKGLRFDPRPGLRNAFSEV